MNISEIYSAMGLKVKIKVSNASDIFNKGDLVRIDSLQENRAFMIQPYGVGKVNLSSVPCETSQNSAEYLRELFIGEKDGAFRCMFAVDVIEEDSVVVQAYTFQSITRYETPITIQVTDDLDIDRLKTDYVWNQLGEPAVFCLNYKSRKKQRDSIRFLNGKRYLIASNTSRGIIAEKTSSLKDKYDMPVDIYVAPEIRFVPVSDTENLNSAFSKALDQITNPATYFSRWDAYDRLSKELLTNESEEFGDVTYSAYSSRNAENGTIYEFQIKEVIDESFKGKELGATEKKRDKQMESSEKIALPRITDVGRIVGISSGKVTTLLNTNDSDSFDIIPTEGVLQLYTAGDRYILARRKAARDRMVGHKSPITSIVALIETGASRMDIGAWEENKPVTEMLRRNYKRADNLNKQQLKALSLAINTPDIALIQGPPGTGKTTVIKAIAERFREIFESKEKNLQKADPEYIMKSPKILISSFQNEAVDNAISAPLPGAMPAYRKTAKRTRGNTKQEYQKALDKWYSGLREEVSAEIEDKATIEFNKTRRKLSDEFLSYRNSGEEPEKAAALISHYLDFIDIPYPKELVDRARELYSALVGKEQDNEDNLFIRLIEAQRTEKESFADDGASNARRLSSYLRMSDDHDVSDEVKEAINAVCFEGYSEADFDGYISAIEKLRKKYCKEKKRINPEDKTAVEDCILELSDFFINHYIETLTDISEKKSLILSEFLDNLGQDYESVVKKYSMTTAATCQTSLDLREGNQQIYDLVIVDEAARANPLDLFIPMSMGKKIVLVGDHKQLPHMLEPDIVKMLKDDPEFKDIPEIEKSLFERLFEMFSKGGHPKAIALTEQYRMHPLICDFVSREFYDGILQTGKDITPEKRAASIDINEGKPLVFVNIPISKGAESKGVSKSRPVEATMISQDIRHIVDVSPEASIGVITFYSAQEALIKEELDSILNDEEKRNVEVGTVDAFQGKEFDYVLLSCVRSNKPMNDKPPIVGFLDKPNRLCVAFSRSIRQLAVYGDIDTLKQIPYFDHLYEYCKNEEGGYCREV